MDRRAWIIVGAWAAFIFIERAYMLIYSRPLFGFWFWVSVVVSFFIVLVFSIFMPKKTTKGTETLWYIMGFKEYIIRAEKYRAQFQEKENIFEKFLPYAIIFGCTKKWAKTFEGIYKTPPSWYQGNSLTVFSVSSFTSSLDKSLVGITGAMASRPGGSGFGGGGGAGGGGGGGGSSAG